MWAHLNDPPPSAAALSPGIPRELDAVIRRGMAKRPEDRYRRDGRLRPGRGAAAGPDVRSAPTLVDAPIANLVVPPAAGATPPASATPPAAAPPPATPTPASPRDPRPRARDPAARDPAARDPAAADDSPPGTGGPPAAPPPPASARRIAASLGRWRGRGHHRRCGPRHRPRKQRLRWFVDHHDDDHVLDHDPDDDLLDDDRLAGAGAGGGLSRAGLADRSRINAVFRQFPNGHDFGKASFNATSLRVAAGLRGIADNLDALSPPSRALVAHETLVNDLRTMEQSFRSLAARQREP